MQLTTNTLLQSGKYRIVRVLGQGGFGITYLAEHTMLGKMVAIKEFFPKEYCDRDENTSHLTIGTKNSVEIVEMLKSKFIKEARNISRLNHRNIITIHDIFQENETAYYVMEYVEGASLAQIVKERGALSESEAVDYISKVADAVGYMHSLSMNHLDLKPANIMVRAADNEPVLIDFGLSKQYDASGGQTSTTPVGISHGFAPVEQYRPGGVSTFTPQTDIYALGATLFNLLTGNVPPHYSEILEDGLPGLPTSVSKRCANAIEHAMEIKKNKRPASVEEFLSELGNEPLSVPIAKPIVVAPRIETPKPAPKVAPKPKSANEETVFIGTPLLKQTEKTAKKPELIDGIEFVDLGLSVKWANMNIGANSAEKCGVYVNCEDYESLTKVMQWNLKGALVPTIGQFDELRANCIWEPQKIGDVIGYKVTGRNGNSIFLPLTGDNADSWLKTFGRLYTRESIFCNSSSHNSAITYYFYYNLHGDYKCVKYACNYKCPVRLVKE